MFFFPPGHTSLGNVAAQYMQGKFNIGGLFSNYLTVTSNSGSSNMAPMYMRHPAIGDISPVRGHAVMGPQVTTTLNSEDEQGLDFRKSSIDKLRLKAKEHSSPDI